MRIKNRMMTFVLAASMSLSLMACGQTESKHNHENHGDAIENETAKQSRETTMSKEDVQKILSAYLAVKNNLVKTDGTTASESAKALISLLDGNNDQLIKEIANDAEHIMGTKDPEHQRSHFNTLSDNVYTLVKNTSANEQPIYRQFCPMAFGNKGAYWLSAEKEVNNPYFGDKMLHCGSVKEEL